MIKKYLTFIILILLGSGFILFGFGDSEWEQAAQQTVQKKENKLTLTKEQQDNVVRWIVRGYDPITQVEFTRFSQDKKTGSYLLSFQLNNQIKLDTTIAISSLEEFNQDYGVLGLNPVNNFKDLEMQEWLPEGQPVDISTIRIIYLED